MQHFDELETRAPQAREAALMAALPAHLAHAKASAPGWARILADVDPARIDSRAALARLPLTRKSDLGELQKAVPPLGGLNATPVRELARLFASPGPIYEPQGRGPDWFRAGRAMFAAGCGGHQNDRIICKMGESHEPNRSYLLRFRPLRGDLQPTRVSPPCQGGERVSPSPSQSTPRPAFPACRAASIRRAGWCRGSRARHIWGRAPTSLWPSAPRS